jgi:hypothetical protein
MLNRIKYWLYLAIPRTYAKADQHTVAHTWEWFGKRWDRETPRHR